MRPFGVGRAAVGALRVSALGVRGASRLAAGRLAARSVASRVAAGLPRSSNSMRAIKSMLGTANPMTRREARAAAQRSLEQGFVPSAGSVGRSLRAVPGEFAHNVSTLRSADWGDALRQARQGGSLHPAQVLGEHGIAADLRDIKKLHNAVRASDEVAPHLHRFYAHYGTFVGAAGYGAYDTGHNAVKLISAQSAAQQLNLPDAHQSVGAGARP